MNLETPVRPDPPSNRARGGGAAERRVDISGMQAEHAVEYARRRSEAARDDVYVEHKGGRTFLVARS